MQRFYSAVTERNINNNRKELRERRRMSARELQKNHLLILDGNLKLWYSVCWVWEYGRIDVLLEKHFHLEENFFLLLFSHRVWFSPFFSRILAFECPCTWFASTLGSFLRQHFTQNWTQIITEYLFRELMSYFFFTSWSSSLFENQICSDLNAGVWQ